MNKKNVLYVKDLNKTYSKNSSKSVHAIKNLNLEVNEGEIFGLLGPNGAGKSTFINILAGTTIKTSGEVNVWGFNLDINPRQVRASIGIVPQEVNVDPFFTPRSILELQAGMYGIKKKDRITDTILKLVSLEQQAKSYTRTLSGGMKRRLLVAKALVHKPPIIILDEPNSNLDDQGERDLLTTLRRVKESGRTIIIITHRTSILSLVDKLLVMKDGVIANMGSKDEIMAALSAPKSNVARLPKKIDNP